MACMKCGRETETGQVFCSVCREVMERYPVKPGTAVQLPKRKDTPIRKLPKRRAPSLEDQIRILKKRISILSFALVISILLTVLIAIPAYEHLFKEHVIPGQNYSTVVPTASGQNGTVTNIPVP